ncbi:MAG TPA: hypothetical protein VFU43_23825 [Streptosporangiaceae bacterium]|nr:hypothetical protein [Streptosporangiaceae bacterium]
MRDANSGAALRSFVEQLNELYQRAGPPKLSRLRQLSEQVVVNQGVTGLRVLAESTTSDILSGKRTRFPDWPWVASFVTACWMAATETAIDPGHLGSVEEWRIRYRKARSAAGDPVASGDAAAGPAGPAAPSGPAATEPASAGDAPAELTPAMRLLTSYKRTGGRLLRHAEAGDAEAAFRLAVLLLCGDRPVEATEWLRRASRAGHADALELLHHPRQQAVAARHAYRIGRDYEAAGNLPAALAFLEQAADTSPQ